MKKYLLEEGIKLIAENVNKSNDEVREYLINSGFAWFNQKQHIIIPYKKYCRSMVKNKKLKFRMFYVELDEDYEATYYISEYGIKYVVKHINDV